MKKLGLAIKTAREAKGLTQSDLAKALGLSSAQFISNIERGVAPLPPHFVPPISRLLQVSEKRLIELIVDVYRSRVLRAVRGNLTS